MASPLETVGRRIDRARASASDAIARYRGAVPARSPSMDTLPAGVMDAAVVRVTDADERKTGSRRLTRFVNPRSGTGGAKDKDIGGDFIATRLSREEAERIYQMSWVAERGVRLIVDDMFARGRRWIGDDEAAIEAMQEAERKLGVMSRLPKAMIAGRLFGTALMIVCEHDPATEPDLTKWKQPLDPDKISKDGIANLWVVDRWSCSVHTFHTDPSKPNYGEPYQYRVSSRVFGSPSPEDAPGLAKSTAAGQVVVHESRVFRFDGREAPLTEGWTSGPWEREWGVSVLTAVLDDIMRDTQNHAGVGHLVQEASIWVQRIHGFKEAIKGRVRQSEASAEEIAEQTNLLKSLYNIVFMDAEDVAERIAVNFAGLHDILNGSIDRVAAIFGIPITRFKGTSAVGLNATGEGDARDWRITVMALQKALLDPVLKDLDMMVAKHAGLAEPPEYEWIPLGDMTELEEAEVTKLLAEGIVNLYGCGLLDEDESRKPLGQLKFIGELGEWAPSQADEMEAERAEAEAAMQAEAMAEAAKAKANGQPPGLPGAKPAASPTG